MVTMNVMQRVLNLEEGNKDKLITSDDWVYITHLLCKTYGWTLQELKKQPIKFIFGLMSKIKWEKDEEKKEREKSRTSFGKK